MLHVIITSGQGRARKFFDRIVHQLPVTGRWLKCAAWWGWLADLSDESLANGVGFLRAKGFRCCADHSLAMFLELRSRDHPWRYWPDYRK